MHIKYIALTQNQTHNPPLLTHGNTSITTTTNMPYFHSSLYNIWPAIKGWKAFPLLFMGLNMCVFAMCYVCFFTLIIPRFLFLLSTCFMFVLFYINWSKISLFIWVWNSDSSTKLLVTFLIWRVGVWQFHVTRCRNCLTRYPIVWLTMARHPLLFSIALQAFRPHIDLSAIHLIGFHRCLDIHAVLTLMISFWIQTRKQVL